MEKLLNKELSLSRRARGWLLFALVCFLTLSLHFCGKMIAVTRRIVLDQAERSITNISELNRDEIARAIDMRLRLLEMESTRFERNRVDNLETVLRKLGDVGNYYDFYSLGVMDEQEKVHLIDGRVLDVSDKGWREAFWNESTHVTPSYPTTVGNEYMLNAFTCPVKIDGEIHYVLVATCKSVSLTELMNISSIEGKGYSYLIDSSGAVVIYPENYDNAQYNALMRFIDASKDILPSKSGDQHFEFEDESYYARFERLDINDWYLMTAVREADAFADARSITAVAIAAVAVLWLIIAAALVMVTLWMLRSRKKRMENAFYDELLGIPNGNALGVIYRNLPDPQPSEIYLVVFDIDKFKEFNYIYGAEEGDELLRYIARVFEEELPEACLFRYFSDFFLTLDYCRDREELDGRIKQILGRFKRDIDSGVMKPFDISAGVRKVEPDEPLRIVMSDALIARETVKGNLIQHYEYYDEKLRRRRLEYVEMESYFPTAIKEHEFKVYYQPKYDMETGGIIGAEALARWIRQDGSIVSPGVFIPCFEESRQIILLDESILYDVCRQMREMQDEGIAVKPVSINLSRIHLRHPGILSKIGETIAEFGIDPSMLSFEITESALYEDSIPLKDIVDYIHSLGCGVEMDDYGVGVSGPNALANNSFDTVKLDKSFVDGIGSRRVEDVIKHTAAMAREWGMDVLAEGVEDMSQAERLVELGCTRAQGYLYSRPVPEAEYRELLRRAEIEPEAQTEARRRIFPAEFCLALDTTMTPIYIIDAENFKIVYANETMRRALERNPVGEQCHLCLRGLSSPCPGCPVALLLNEGINEEHEFYHPSGIWVLVRAALIRWQGRDYYKVTCTDITKQKLLETELRRYARECEAVVRYSTSGILRYNIATGDATLNIDKSMNLVEEYTLSSDERIAFIKGMVAPESVPTARDMFMSINLGKPCAGYDLRLLPEGKEPRWCHIEYSLISDGGERPCRAVLFLMDITEKREMELAYQRWNARLNTIMSEYISYMEVNLTRDIIESEGRKGEWDKNVGGRCFSESVANMAERLVSEQDRIPFMVFFNRERLLGRFMSGVTEGSFEYRTSIMGSMQWYRAELQLVSDPESGNVLASILISNVDSDLRERELLARNAELDSMTGLYNHAMSEQLMRDALRESDSGRCCFLIIDLDDLRTINSELGHPEGDRAICAIAERMKEYFPEGSVLGRIGGDEFAALVRNAPQGAELTELMQGFVRSIREVSIGEDDSYRIHVSVGAALGAAGETDFDTLYREADLALYYTKAMGKDNASLYEQEMQERNFSYKPQSPATLVSMESFDSGEFKKLMMALSAYYPMVISVNLTQNSYYMMEYASYVMQSHRSHGRFDQLIEDGVRSFHPDDKQSFLDAFSRTSLLAAHARGERIVRHQGRQLGDDGIYRLTQGIVVFTEDPSGDICEITFSHTVIEGE